MRELDRRARAAGAPLASVAAHPGYAATNLQIGVAAGRSTAIVIAVLNRVVAQSADARRAAVALRRHGADLPSGSYVGPDGPASGAAARSSSRMTAARAATPTTRGGCGRSPSS